MVLNFLRFFRLNLNRIQIISFVASLLIHIIIFFVCLKLTFKTLPSPLKSNEEIIVNIQISTAKKLRKIGKFQVPISTPIKSPQIKISDFFPPLGIPKSHGKNQLFNENGFKSSAPKDWEDSYQYGRALESNGTLSELSGFYREIHRRIDSLLVFEKGLTEFSHFGRLFFYFEVRPDGVLIPSSLKASAADRVLKVKVARAIRLGLAKSFPESLSVNSNSSKEKRLQNIRMAAQFFFSKDPTCKGVINSSTSWLTFCRWSSERPIAKNLWGEIVQLMEPKSFYDEKDPTSMKMGASLPYEELLEYKQKMFRKNTQFDPYLQETQSLDWNL